MILVSIVELSGMPQHSDGIDKHFKCCLVTEIQDGHHPNFVEHENVYNI